MVHNSSSEGNFSASVVLKKWIMANDLTDAVAFLYIGSLN